MDSCCNVKLELKLTTGQVFRDVTNPLFGAKGDGLTEYVSSLKPRSSYRFFLLNSLA
jgi:hypothetical protein